MKVIRFIVLPEHVGLFLLQPSQLNIFLTVFHRIDRLSSYLFCPFPCLWQTSVIDSQGTWSSWAWTQAWKSFSTQILVLLHLSYLAKGVTTIFKTFGDHNFFLPLPPPLILPSRPRSLLLPVTPNCLLCFPARLRKPCGWPFKDVPSMILLCLTLWIHNPKHT